MLNKINVQLTKEFYITTMKTNATSIHAVIFTLSTLLTCSTFSVSAADDIDNVTMQIATSEAKRGHRILMHSRDTILNFMLQNGDITTAEIESRKASRIAERQELRTLKQSGDTEAYQARLAEIKAERQSQREALKNYINEHDELKQSLQEQKQEHRERLKEQRREQRNEKKNERRDNKRERKNG